MSLRRAATSATSVGSSSPDVKLVKRVAASASVGLVEVVVELVTLKDLEHGGKASSKALADSLRLRRGRAAVELELVDVPGPGLLVTELGQALPEGGRGSAKKNFTNS